MIASIHSSNAALVERYQESEDRQAFGELYKRYYEKVFRYCVAILHDRENAFDITQDTFLRAAEHLSELRVPWTFTAWLFRIARNQCINFLHEKKSRIIQTDDIMQEPAAEQPDLEYREEKERRLTAIESLLNELSEDARTMLQLKYREGYSIEDLQKMYGLSESAVKMRLLRARDKIAQAYFN